MAQYDNISKEYQSYSTTHPWVMKILLPSLSRMLGDIRGSSVLELACGDGAQSRWMKKLGADKVVGVDISKGMIDEAIAGAKKANLHIDYIVSDAGALGKLGDFDIITVCYLLNYASSRPELLNMCYKIKTNLKLGGKVVGITPYVNADQYYHVPEKHGFYLQVPDNLQEGDKITGTTRLNDTTFSATWFYNSQESHEWAFREAGFTHFEWRRLGLYDNASLEDVEFYQDLVDHPFDMGFIAW